MGTFEHLKDKIEEVEQQKLVIVEREKAFAQKERTIKLLKEQLEQFEQTNEILEKSKQRLELEIQELKQLRIEDSLEKSLIDTNLKKTQEDMITVIKDKSLLEEQLQASKSLVNQLKGILSERSEFQSLETLVNKLQSMIVL